MENDLEILRVLMRRIEGTDNDYELITVIDDAFKSLSEKSIKAINDISGEYTNFIQEIIRLDSENKEKEDK